jgi:hypothetical protein
MSDPVRVKALKKVFDLLEGPSGVSRALGARGITITPWACNKWLRQGRLPRTDYTGETNYAEQLERAVKGEVTAASMLGIEAAAAAR